MISLEALMSKVDPDVADLDPNYVAKVENGLKTTGLLDSMIAAETEGHSIFDHSVGVATVALEIARRNDYSGRDVVNACIGGLIHDAGKSLYAPVYSEHDSVDLEVRLREQGLLELGQSVRHNPYLVTADARYHRLTPSQYAVTMADAVTDRLGRNIGLQARRARTADEKNINADFHARYTDRLPYYQPGAEGSALLLGITFVERFDGRYPISTKPESHGKLSSLHIARCLGYMGIKPTVMGYVEGGNTFNADGVLIDGNNTIEHLDEKIYEAEIAFVTGWTSAYERLRQRAVPANLVMRSILETSLTAERLERIRAAGRSCILVSQESFEKIGVNQEATFIPNGYDEDIFYYEANEIKKQIFFSGALVPEKGVDHLMKIAEEMPDYEFIVAGSSGMYGADDQFLDMPPNVTRLGEVSQQVIAEQYRRSMVSLVLTDPSRIFEVVGKSGIESTISGCPLVYIKNGGLNSNIVRHELTASVDSASITELISCIKSIEAKARDHNLRESLALKAEKRHLTWKQVATFFLARGLDSIVESESQKQTRNKSDTLLVV